MVKFYMGGKISKGDWRHTLCDSLRSGGAYDPHYNYTQSIRTNNGHDYVGPWFVSCDHGCSHGDNKHGALNGCDDNNRVLCKMEDDWHGSSQTTPVRREVANTCMKGIQCCDVFFAWINSNDCYGTLAEIGYAKALGKTIWIAYAREFMSKQLENQNSFVFSGFNFNHQGGVEYGSPRYNKTTTHEMWFIDQLADKVVFGKSAHECFNFLCSYPL